jgi:hypothetical protein
VNLDPIHHILDVELAQADFGSPGAMTRSARLDWLEWTVASYEHLAALYQPPYGDRAVALIVGTVSNVIIGAVGFVPNLGPFGQLPTLGGAPSRNSAELGLYYAI